MSAIADQRIDVRIHNDGDAGADLLVLQTEYVAWLDVLPGSLSDSATAEALQAIADLDLEALAEIEPPCGYGVTEAGQNGRYATTFKRDDGRTEL